MYATEVRTLDTTAATAACPGFNDGDTGTVSLKETVWRIPTRTRQKMARFRHAQSLCGTAEGVRRNKEAECAVAGRGAGIADAEVPTNPEPSLTLPGPKDVAKTLEVDLSTIYRLIDHGDLAAFDVSCVSTGGRKKRTLRISQQSIDDFLTRRRVKPNQVSASITSGRRCLPSGVRRIV
jgi:hypothetical protein